MPPPRKPDAHPDIPDRREVLELVKLRLASSESLDLERLGRDQLEAAVIVDHALRRACLRLEATLWGRVVRSQARATTRRRFGPKITVVEGVEMVPLTWWDHLKRDVLLPLLRAWSVAVGDTAANPRLDCWPAVRWLHRVLRPRTRAVVTRVRTVSDEHVREEVVEEWHVCPHVKAAPSSAHLRFLAPVDGDVERHRREHAFVAAARCAKACLEEVRKDPWLRHAFDVGERGRFADALDAMAHYVEQAGL